MKESPLKDVLNTQPQSVHKKLPLYIGATILEAAGTILLALVISIILSGTLFQNDIENIHYLLLGLSLVARFVAELIQNHIKLETGTICETQLRQSVVSRISQNRNAVDGEAFSSLFTRAVTSIGDYCRVYLPVSWKAMVAPPILLLAVFYIDFISGLILLLASAATILLLILTGNLSRKKKARQWGELRSVRRHFIEIIAGSETMRQLEAGERFRDTLKRRADRFRDLTMGVLKIVFLSSLALELMASISVAMVAVVLGIRLSEGSFSYQKALMVLILVPELFSYIRHLGAARHTLMEAESVSPLVRSFLFDTPLPDIPVHTSQKSGNVQFSGRSFKLGIVLLGAAVITLAAHFSQMGLMVISAALLARCALQTSISALHVLVAGVRFFRVARPILRYAERLITHYIALLFFKKIRLAIFDWLKKQDSRTLRHLHSGEVLRTFDADTEKLDNVGPKIVWPLFTAVIAVVVLPFIPPFSSISPRWLLILLLWGVIILPWLFYGHLPDLTGSTGIDSYALDYARGVKDAAVFDPNAKQAQKLLHIAESENLKNRSLQWRVAQLGAVSLILMYAVWGLILRNYGHLEGESLALVIFGVMSFSDLFHSIPHIVGLTKESSCAYHRIRNFFSRQVPAVLQTPIQERGTSQFLTIRNLNWAWPGSNELLFKNLNLKLEKGKKYGWVGPVGSGKSTLLDIVTGFQPVPKGVVFLQGYDVSDTDQSILLENVGYVSQRSFVFRGSIRDNLQLANSTISDEEMEKILCLVGLSPQQYDIEKDLGENAVILSGGERQRLILARAMAQNREIILLDEPFNNLDRDTQNRILRWMKSSAHWKTFIMITHQKNGLDQMDEVISVFE